MKCKKSSSAWMGIFWAFFIFLIIGFTSVSNATVFQQPFPLIQKKINEPTKLKIILYRGSVEYIADEKLRDLTISIKKMVNTSSKEKAAQLFAKYNFKQEEQPKLLSFSVQGPQERKEVKTLMQAPDSEDESVSFHFEIKGPSQALEYAAKNGSIKIKSLKAPIKIAQLKGEVKIENSDSDMAISNQQGSVQIVNHKGKLSLDSVSSDLKLKNIDGAIELVNFSGPTNLSSWNGDLVVKTYQGNTNLEDGKGGLDFQNGRGILRISGLEGVIKGVNGQGNMSISVKSKVEIRLTSDEGILQIKVPKESGAFVNVTSKEGSLNGPESLQIRNEPDMRYMQGNLKGEESGVIRVQAKAGQVRIGVY